MTAEWPSSESLKLISICLLTPCVFLYGLFYYDVSNYILTARKLLRRYFASMLKETVYRIRLILGLSTWPQTSEPRLTRSIGSTALTKNRRLSNQDNVFLSKLPFEIRVIIYDLCLAGYDFGPREFRPFLLPRSKRWSYYRSTDLRLNVQCATPMEAHRWRRSLLPLLMVCRQIYIEGTPILYSKNSFTIKYREDMYSFLRHLSKHHVNCIRKIRFHYLVNPSQKLDKATERDWIDMWSFFAHTFPTLKELTLIVGSEKAILSPFKAWARAVMETDSIPLEPVLRMPIPVVLVPNDGHNWKGTNPLSIDVEAVKAAAAFEVDADEAAAGEGAVLRRASTILRERIRGWM